MYLDNAHTDRGEFVYSFGFGSDISDFWVFRYKDIEPVWVFMYFRPGSCILVRVRLFQIGFGYLEFERKN